MHPNNTESRYAQARSLATYVHHVRTTKDHQNGHIRSRKNGKECIGEEGQSCHDIIRQTSTYHFGHPTIKSPNADIQYLHSVYTEDYDPSFESAEQKHLTIDGQTYNLELLPAEPQGENLLCQTGQAFILLYAINNRKSFQHLRQLHTQIRQTKATPNLAKFPIYLVGSKADLESERVVSLEEGRQLAIELKCQKLFEVSAKDHVAEINDMFEKLVRQFIQIDTGIPAAATRPPASPRSPTSPAVMQSPPSVLSQAPSSPSAFDDSPRRSGVIDRLKFGSLRRKSSRPTMNRKESGSFTESFFSTKSAAASRSDVRSVSYGARNGTPTRSTTYSQVTTPASTPAPPPASRSASFRLDVDTSSWREAVKWPTEIIPEEDIRTNGSH